MKLINIIKIGVSGLCALSLNAFAHNPNAATTPSPMNQTESAHPLKDAEITAKVKEQMIQQKLFDKTNVAPMSVHVKTVNGTVFLTGKVLSKEEADNAISITKGISGVKEVKSEIEIVNKAK